MRAEETVCDIAIRLMAGGLDVETAYAEANRQVNERNKQAEGGASCNHHS